MDKLYEFIEAYYTKTGKVLTPVQAIIKLQKLEKAKKFILQ